MTPEEWIVQKAKEYAGDGVAVKPHPAPASVGYPLVTYQRTATRPLRSLSGDSNFETCRFLINCWDHDFSTAYNLGKLIKKAFNGVADRALGIKDVGVENDFSDFDEDERVWRRAIEIVVQFSDQGV